MMHYSTWFSLLLALLLTACWSEPPAPTPTVAPTSMVTAEAISQTCQAARPKDWVSYTVESGDTLLGLAEAREVTVEQLKQANCLTSDLIVAGGTLYLPPPCRVSAPADWIPYQVRQNDTLFSLAEQRRTSVAEIARVNCLQAEGILNIGQTLYLPAAPTPTFTSIPTPTDTPLPPPTATPSPTRRPTPTRPLVTPTPGIVALGPTPQLQVPSNIGSNQSDQAPNIAPADQPDAVGGGGDQTQAGVAGGGTPSGSAPPSWPLALARVVNRPVTNPDSEIKALIAERLDQFAKYVPCQSGQAIESVFELVLGEGLEPGQRDYFFICPPSSTNILSATITFPDKSQSPIKLLTKTPHLDLTNPPGLNDQVIEFLALPDKPKPTGEHILTIFYRDGTTGSKPFKVLWPSSDAIHPHILVLPSQKPNQNNYLIYSVGFTLTLTHPYTFGLYREQTDSKGSQRVGSELTPVIRTYEPVPYQWWTLPTTTTTVYTSPIENLFWFTHTLTLTPTDFITRAYAIGYENHERDQTDIWEPDWLFWPELLRRQTEQ